MSEKNAIRERLLDVLLEPRITEKATRIGERNNQFIFKVARDASKPEIKEAVEQLFEVQVSAVQVLNMKGKRKRFGITEGRRDNWKKAYVTLKPGFDIDFMGAK
ncbi:MAG: 50S ribosomal protein L23 [Gammaproteobacteria bacterium]|nr:50S ribosomal protein L23 [Gammaproteobacteria bacterium]